MPKKILFIISHSIKTGPSQRFRIGLYLPYLDRAGFRYKIRSFYAPGAAKITAQKGRALSKARLLLSGILRRCYTLLFEAWAYDYIFIQREAAPVGPPLFEWTVAKLWRKKVIYEFDDAVWIPTYSKRSGLYGLFKAPWKISYNCKWSYKVVAGNHFLHDFAKKYNSNTCIIPTCVDTEAKHNKIKEHEDKSHVVVGWTGSHSTLKYLHEIAPVIQKLQRELGITFLVICNKSAEEILPDSLFVPWSAASEVSDLLQMDIGVMPLEDNDWSRGKCGFKLIQYMSLGIPVVASPVGVNAEIVTDGVEGFLCGRPEEWEQALRTLIQSADLRKKMGSAGRKKIENNYSIKANQEQFTRLFS